MSTVKEIRSTLSSLKSQKKAAALHKHFKAGPGEYAAGDRFLGIDMANQRRIAKENYASISFDELEELIKISIHEYRMTALMMLVYKFAASKKESDKKAVFDFYIDHLDFVNNWDLVDTTAERIAGAYLLDKDKSVLVEMSKSRRLWRERLSLLASIHFVKHKDFATSLELITHVIDHHHELIHQAVGKVFTEIIKADVDAAEEFLEKYSRKMHPGILKHAVANLSPDRQAAYKNKMAKSEED